ncbi:HYC_CC_PP family protein [Maribacter thermophilus]|uniref:HYC_CC_PP family protein n=1 Tax=Maribacter thermophilus TaxID=1197874 RepID=UPI00069A3ED2|nr:hypothetical protein [Maribacter thermophilus]
MKNLLHKLFSVSMALLLLLSTISWTVEKHMCMGRIMDIALFDQAESCCPDIGFVSLKDEGIKKEHCCHNEAFTMQGQDNLTHNFSDVSFSQQVFLVSFTSSYVGLFREPILKNTVFRSYPPPLLDKDLNILHQVFLI